MRSAIVTGGAGFIGSRLVKRMVDKGWYVHVIDDFSTHTSPSLYSLPDSNVSFSNGRVQDHSWYKFKTYPPELIVHLASKVGPVGVLKHKGSIVKDTVDAADKVSIWAYEFKCPLLFISTSEVYGNDSKSNRESDPTTIQLASARSEYAAAKLASEHMLLNRMQSSDWKGQLDVRVIRPFNIAGPGQRPEGGFVLPRWIQAYKAGKKMTIYGDGRQRRAFTHVDDFIDGLGLVFTKGTPGEIYNLGNEENAMTMYDLAREIVAHRGDPTLGNFVLGKIEFVDPVDIHGPDFREAPEKIPDSTKARTELGWSPYRTVCDIVRVGLEEYENTRARAANTK